MRFNQLIPFFLSYFLMVSCNFFRQNSSQPLSLEGPNNGTFPVRWNICEKDTEPIIQKWRFKKSTFIFRQSLCTSFEAPFMYFLVGDNEALLFDTGTRNEKVSRELFATIEALRESKKVYVVSSHRHSDHIGGDWIFKDKSKENYTLIGGDWAGKEKTIDLGNRKLIILPVPGHDNSSIAIYDEKEKLLLSGDTLYPGHLFVSDWSKIKESFKHLFAFSMDHKIDWILGGHIELTAEQEFIPYGSESRKSEFPLQLPIDFLKQVVNKTESTSEVFTKIKSLPSDSGRFFLCKFGDC